GRIRRLRRHPAMSPILPDGASLIRPTKQKTLLVEQGFKFGR
ncbi:hypothetical protein HMPREF3212_02775, partial [Citrobacter freundii]